MGNKQSSGNNIMSKMQHTVEDADVNNNWQQGFVKTKLPHAVYTYTSITMDFIFELQLVALAIRGIGIHGFEYSQS